MALDATVGGASANSYLTVAEADAYFAARLWGTAWTSISLSTTKEALLEWAARLLDQQSWVGGRATATQALRWPRAGVRDLDGYIVGNAVIPQWLKNAACEWALALAQGDRTKDMGSFPLERVKVGPVDATFAKGAGMRSDTIPGPVMDIIAPYITNSPGNVKLVRA